MIAKLLFFVTIINLTLGTNVELPRNDLVILKSGERVEGQINYILDGVINIQTDKGEKLIVRDVNINSTRDIIETGIINNKRTSGHVVNLNKDFLEIKTTSGKELIRRPKVRKIIISHDTALPPLNL